MLEISSWRHTLLRRPLITLKKLPDIFPVCKFLLIIHHKNFHQYNSTNEFYQHFRFFDFPNEAELWDEVQQITVALRNDDTNVSSQFHRELFSHMLTGCVFFKFCKPVIIHYSTHYS